MKDILIDCDPGIDDALALWLAAGSGELNILAVTTVAGNRPAAITCANAAKLMALAGRSDVPVYAGAHAPLGHTEARCNLVHGEDGLGGVALGPGRPAAPRSAAEGIVALLQAHRPGAIELVATGPLTNLALAEALAPGILARAARIVIMGGALRVPGNITPAAEFNFYADPIAAQLVLHAGADVVLFPLDVTSQAVMHAEWIASFGRLETACGRAAAAMLAAYARFDPLLHDACPVAYLINPALFAAEACSVTVDCRPGLTEGYCLAHFGAAASAAAGRVTAVTSVDLAPLLNMVRERIGRLP